jgi:hypothetical protein
VDQPAFHKAKEKWVDFYGNQGSEMEKNGLARPFHTLNKISVFYDPQSSMTVTKLEIGVCCMAATPQKQKSHCTVGGFSISHNHEFSLGIRECCLKNYL